MRADPDCGSVNVSAVPPTLGFGWGRASANSAAWFGSPSRVGAESSSPLGVPVAATLSMATFGREPVVPPVPLA